jgi:hypothetical protein
MRIIFFPYPSLWRKKLPQTHPLVGEGNRDQEYLVLKSTSFFFSSTKNIAHETSCVCRVQTVTTFWNYQFNLFGWQRWAGSNMDIVPNKNTFSVLFIYHHLVKNKQMDESKKYQR